MADAPPGNPFAPTHVAVICHDGPDAGPTRKAAAQAHLAYVETIIDRLLMAGPLYSEDGSAMIGSLYLFKTASLDEARRLLEGDPYFKASFWKSIEIRPTLPAAGDCVSGGKAW
jgi:uncharacterized protein YciI